MDIEQFITCQPEFVKTMLDTAETLILPTAISLKQKKIKRFILTGCGSSFHAALTLSWVWKQEAHLPVEAISAFDFIQAYPAEMLDATVAVIAISQSGMSVMTERAIGYANKAGSTTVAIVANPESKLAVTANHSVLFMAQDEHVGPKTKGYTGSVVAGILLIQLSYDKRKSRTIA